MITEANCFDMIFLILFIYTQVLCRLRSFNRGLKGGFVFVFMEEVLVASFICSGNGVSNFWIIFPFRVELITHTG